MFQKKIFKKILTIFFIIACIFAIYFSLDSIFSNSKIQAAWYTTGGTWTHRKSIVVDHQKVVSVATPGSPTTETFSTAGYAGWTAPAGVTSADVACWGGGGAGFTGNTAGGGHGGGGGAFASSTVAVIPETLYTLYIGAGGTASGGNGEDSTFATTTVVADGGLGGTGVTNGGGTGGTVANSTGTVRYAGGDGGDGANGTGNNDQGGGGGGAGGPHGNGNAGSAATASVGGAGGSGSAGSGGTAGTAGDGGNGGTGGTSVFGGGGGGGADNGFTGGAGGTYGGGGGGGETAGGNGGSGACTITYTSVTGGGAHTNFPMLVSVIDPDLKHTSHGGKMGKTDGTDILFTSADGSTKLDHEIEKYASTTGELVAWVKIPSLSPTVDTQLYMYFGNSGAADQQNATGVWSGDYLAVWHLKSNSNGTLNGDDSTSNNYDGTLYNTPTVTSSFIGGEGGSFVKASSQRIASSSGPNIANSEFTVSFWQKQTSSDANMVTFNLGTSANNTQVIHFVNPSDTIYRFGMWNDDLTVSSLQSIVDRWIYVTATLDSSFSQSLFHNASKIGSRTASGYFTGNTSWNIGAIFSGSSFFNGVIDEVRISNVVRSDDWIATEYNNQLSPNTFYSYGGLEKETRSNASTKATSNTLPGFSWYNTSWTNAKPILVDRTKVAATLYDFPMLVSVIDPDLRHTSHGGKVGKTDGTDILFTDSDGTTKLDHEIEKYASTTGELVAWVKVVTLSHTADTGLYMYFGNSGAADQQNATGVWDGDYIGVYHLSEGYSTAAGFYKDSTANANHATLTDADGSVNQVTGKMASAMKFSGSSDLILTPITNNLGDFTVSVWFNDDTTAASIHERYVDKNYSSGFWLGRAINTTTFGGGIRESGSPYGDYVSLSNSVWNYLVMSRSGTSKRIDGNGGSVSSVTTETSTALDSTAIVFGANTGGGDATDSRIDEVRISSIARSPEWITTEYNNQYSPNTFYSYGGLMSQTRQKPSGAPAPNINNRGGVKFR